MLFNAVVYLAGSVLALRLLGVRRALRMFDRKPSGNATEVGTAESRTVDICTAAVERAAHATGMGTCLSKSMALCALLSARGIDGDLRIGVNRRSGRITAHAWVETGATGRAYQGTAFDVVFPITTPDLPAE